MVTPVNPPDSHHRLRKLTSKDLPIILSIVAVIISLLTYIDQHNADRAAAYSTEEANAATVSFWLVRSKTPGHLADVAVENSSVLPISNVRVLVTAIGYPFIRPPGTELYSVTVSEYTLPPCSVFTNPALQMAKSLVIQKSHVSHPHTRWRLSISIEFTDASGLTWTRSVTGTLKRSAGNQLGDGQGLSVPIPSNTNITKAPGC